MDNARTVCADDLLTILESSRKTQRQKVSTCVPAAGFCPKQEKYLPAKALPSRYWMGSLRGEAPHNLRVGGLGPSPLRKCGGSGVAAAPLSNTEDLFSDIYSSRLGTNTNRLPLALNIS